jgi:hypothetical protein
MLLRHQPVSVASNGWLAICPIHVSFEFGLGIGSGIRPGNDVLTRALVSRIPVQPLMTKSRAASFRFRFRFLRRTRVFHG